MSTEPQILMVENKNDNNKSFHPLIPITNHAFHKRHKTHFKTLQAFQYKFSFQKLFLTRIFGTDFISLNYHIMLYLHVNLASKSTIHIIYR